MKSFTVKSISVLLVLVFIFVPVLGSVCPFIRSLESSAASAKIDSKLPVVYINTESGKNPGRDDNTEYFKGSMRIELNDYYADCQNIYTGEEMLDCKIRTRGNSTRTFIGAVQTGKFAYRIKLDKKVDMFGMGASKNWILLSNIYDQTHMRNMVGLELARALGVKTCESTWVVLYLNGEYRGLYQFCEKIDTSSNSMDITDWDSIIKEIAYAIGEKEGMNEKTIDKLRDRMEADLSWVTTGTFEGYKISDFYKKKLDITSGYIIEHDSFDNPNDDRPYLFEGKKTPMGTELKIDIPEATYTNNEMNSYVRELILDFEEAISSDNFCTSDGRHYSELCDLESLVDFWIVRMVLMTGELGIRSMFYYIEDGKLYFGPVWDFDCGAGNSITVTTAYDEWNGNREDRNFWYKALYRDSYFLGLLQDRFAEIKPTLDSILDSMEIYRAYIEAEAERDYNKYGPRYFNSPSKKSGTFDEEYAFYYQWQKNRIAWLEEQLFAGFPDIAPGITVPGATVSSVSTRISTVMTQAGGSVLTSDNITQRGVKSGFVYDLTKGGDISFTMTTEHTTSVNFELYINGKYYNTYPLVMGETTTGTVKASALNLTPGARNTFHLVIYSIYDKAYRRLGYSVLVSDLGKIESNDVIVQLGKEFTKIKKGSKFTIPTHGYERDGFTFDGWTDGMTMYDEGETITVNKSIALYESWTHVDGKEVLYADSTDILYGNGVLPTTKGCVKHVYYNACDTTCNTCGHTRSITHNYKTSWAKNTTKHWQECSVCTAKKDEATHTYDSDCDTSCNICGYIRTITHNYSEEWSKDISKHWYECSVCEAKKDEANHTPGDPATDTTDQVCTVCGYVIQVSLGHTHTYENWEKDGENHWKECSCGEKSELSAHAWNNGEVTTPPSVDSEGEKTFTCTVCLVTKVEKVDKLDTPAVDDPETPDDGNDSPEAPDNGNNTPDDNEQGSGETDKTETPDTPKDEDKNPNTTVAIISVVAAVAVLGGASAAVLIIVSKKKKK